jgi:hypothetical protein
MKRIIQPEVFQYKVLRKEFGPQGEINKTEENIP